MGSSTYVCCIKNRNKKKRIKEKKGENKKYKNLNGFCYVDDMWKREKPFYFTAARMMTWNWNLPASARAS